MEGELSEVHLQMEMTGLEMTGLYCVIVPSSGWVSTCRHLVPQTEMAFPAFSLSAVSQCDKGLLGAEASASQELNAAHTHAHTDVNISHS